MYNSEHGQDKWLNENIFKNKKNGVFVEFGAIDGLLTSNTLYFEKSLGWDGLLIEPIKSEFVKIDGNRKCFAENYAISDEAGHGEFMVYPDCIGWSGLTENMEPEHLDRIRHNGGERRIIPVEMIRLDTLLDKYGMDEVDYMTIDVEGNEEKVIRSLDLKKYSIGIIDIENNFGRYDITDYMVGNGYKHIARLGVNDIFKREGYKF